MDQRETRIKEEIEGIRGAMNQKVEMIGRQVHKTVEGTKSMIDGAMWNIDQVKGTIEETKLAMDKSIDTINLAVDETFVKVKSTADFVDQVKQNPWIMFGTAILMGYALGCLNRGEVLSAHQAHIQHESSSQLNGYISASSLS